MKKKMYGAKSNARVVPRNARNSRKLREAMEMRRGYGILGLLLVAACSTTEHHSFGPEIEGELGEVLAARQTGEAALVNGQAIYWIPVDGLVAERQELMRSLLSTPYVRRVDPSDASAVIARAEEASIEAAKGVIAWMKLEVFEAAYPAGTLHVERSMFPDPQRATYRVLLFQENRVLHAGAKQGDTLDLAWRRLATAAAGQSMVQVDGESGERPRPLKDMRRVGIDFRGLVR